MSVLKISRILRAKERSDYGEWFGKIRVKWRKDVGESHGQEKS